MKKETLGLVLAACLWAVYLLIDTKKTADAQQCTGQQLPVMVKELWPPGMSITGVASWRRKGGGSHFDGHVWSPEGGDEAMRALKDRLAQRGWSDSSSSTQAVFNSKGMSLIVDLPCPSCGDIHFVMKHAGLVPACQ